MPRFYFHLRNDMSVDDQEGSELPDMQAARARAEKWALNMAAASVLEQRKINLQHRIDVADESGHIVLKVQFGEVVRVET